MSKDIHNLVQNKIITSFKKYGTTVQDTILQIAGDRLQKSYDLTEEFTEIMLEPDYLRPDIIKAKAQQYGFDIRGEASLTEQIKLLDAINTIRSKRGSIESIEHMWTYYGGDLPKDITIDVPAKEIFRYSSSTWSGTHRFQDNSYYRSGVYNINIEGDYDLNSLRDFINRELVAAGTSVNYNKKIFSRLDSTEEGTASANSVHKNTILDTQPRIISFSKNGLVWSSSSVNKTWSGLPDLLVDILRLYEIDLVDLGLIDPHEIQIVPLKSSYIIILSDDVSKERTIIYKKLNAICTPIDSLPDYDTHFYNEEGEELINNSTYPGYFVLGETLLGKVVR